MIPYASRPTTRRNIEVLRSHGWRVLVTPGRQCESPQGFRYALDNGAWSAFQQKKPFPQTEFIEAVAKVGSGADWLVIPDIVAGGTDSLEFSLRWLPLLRSVNPLLLLAVQDGMKDSDVVPILDREDNVGLFVGGTTSWKLATLEMWGDVCAFFERHLHVGRVNSRRRIRKCALAGADSFDGSSATIWSVTTPTLDAENRQQVFCFREALA